MKKKKMSLLAKSMSSRMESKETPKMEAMSHGKPFLKKALAMK